MHLCLQERYLAESVAFLSLTAFWAMMYVFSPLAHCILKPPQAIRGVPGGGLPLPIPTPRSEDSAIPVSMDGHRLIHTNGTLLLRAVKAEDSGYYTCTATNTGGFDTIIVNLLVQGETL